MPALDIRPISAAETRPLRQQLLRPRRSLEQLVYPGDDAPDSLHAGAFLDGQLVGIASISRQPFAPAPGAAAWQLRGMAARPEVRRQGYGAALIQACIAHAASRGGTILWCNGRTSAIPFYQALGFQVHGAEFENPETGPHVVLWRAIGTSSPHL
jgi:GNAT superfamily N-acetyltransferase